ncbi:VC_2705 family sodium/solute symporter [Ideonella sp. A 288]|uniref:VC_2705 family sodium/solute symporter n=1 Tax=Ideonella sp. A 288 TaxID=1962181 RepID=UPI000B4BE0E6|nr:VC_2705 family sodium/solute symporter [Ideonella sp. A 288]
MAARQPPTELISRVFRDRLNRRYALFAVAVVLFVIALALLERSGWPRSWISASFLIATVLVYAGIGLASRTTIEAEYYVAGRRVPAMYNGMATAADWMSAASFIGTAGVIYLQGFSGLAYILGWTGGFCLVALLLAPYLRRFGRFTVPDFLGARYGGRMPRLIGVAATVLVSFVYVVVQVYGIGLITSHLTGFNFEIGIFVGLGGVLVCSFLGGMRAVTWTQVAQYIVLILAYMVPVLWLNVNQNGSWAPLFSYDKQLQIVTEREAQLLIDTREIEVRRILEGRAVTLRGKLADPSAALTEERAQLEREIQLLRAQNTSSLGLQQLQRRLERLPRNESEARAQYQRELDQTLVQAAPLAGLAPQVKPYPVEDSVEAISGIDRRNFLALVFCLMLGTAAMPHVLMRYYTSPSVASARNSVGWSLFFIAMLYLSAPAFAVMVKYEVFTEIVGMPFADLPAWIRRWSKIDPSQVGVQDINGDGFLQLAELRLGGDLIVLAAPEIGGLPVVVTYLVAAGGLAAALSTADGLLLTIASALSYDLYYREINPKASPIRRVMLSKMLVLLVAIMAAWAASARMAGILPFVTTAFSLAAAAFFPALVAGIFWRRANRAGAVAGMFVGLAVCIGYIVANLPVVQRAWGLASGTLATRWFNIDPIAAGVFGVPAGLLALVVVSLLTAPPGPDEMELLRHLRSPEAQPGTGRSGGSTRRL